MIFFPICKCDMHAFLKISKHKSGVLMVMRFGLFVVDLRHINLLMIKLNLEHLWLMK